MIEFLEKIRKQREFKLIINADDFGISKSITDGIIEGISDGYILLALQ